MKKTILITGGAGFIGSHVVECCLERGHSVVVMDNLSTGRREHLPEGITFLQTDLLHADLSRIFKEHDITDICHLAAKVSVRNSSSDFIDDALTNFIGSLRLMRAAQESPIQSFVLASTMAVYADATEPHPLSESYPTQPLSPYGVSKLAAERDLFLLFQSSPCRIVSLRYFNTFGPRQQLTPYVGVITIFSEALKEHRPITIFGDGNQRRDFIFVKDVAHATVNALENRSAQGIFNIGTGTGHSVNEIATYLLKKFGGHPSQIHYAPKQAVEVTHSIADNSRAREILNFEPTLSVFDYLNAPSNG